MFDRKKFDDVIEDLKNDVAFASEAHLQMSFIKHAMKRFGDKFEYLPEYSVIDKNYKRGHYEVDLLIVDNSTKEKTMIEFKHKTTNSSSDSLVVSLPCGVAVIPSNMAAQDIGRFDCWSDIERIVKHKHDKNGQLKISNGFFLLVTNDELYWTKTGTTTYGNDFSIKEDSAPYRANTKKWNTWNPVTRSVDPKIEEAIGKQRNRTITITQDCLLEWDNFKTINHTTKGREKSRGLYRYLVVEI